jgi:hypothetical protein
MQLFFFVIRCLRNRVIGPSFWDSRVDHPLASFEIGLLFAHCTPSAQTTITDLLQCLQLPDPPLVKQTRMPNASLACLCHYTLR